MAKKGKKQQQEYSGGAPPICSLYQERFPQRNARTLLRKESAWGSSGRGAAVRPRARRIATTTGYPLRITSWRHTCGTD
ncbi:unnamed protein product [Closterium sp. NIES-54]